MEIVKNKIFKALIATCGDKEVYNCLDDIEKALDLYLKSIMDCLPEEIPEDTPTAIDYIDGFNSCRDQFLLNLKNKRLIE